MSFGMFLNYNYVFIAAITAIFVSILANNNLQTDVKRYFYEGLILSVLLAIGYNLDIYYSAFSEYHWIRVLASAVVYVTKPAVFYIFILINLRDSENRRIKGMLLIPTLLQLLLSVSMFFSKIFVYYDEHNFYHGGPLHFYAYFVLGFYILAFLICSFVNSKTSKTEFGMILAICLMISFNICYQMLFYVNGVNFDLTTIALAIVAYYIYFMTDSFSGMNNKKSDESTEAEKNKKILQQTIEAFAYAVDAKDPYAHGHSLRVAEYSRNIAKMAGKSEEECEEIYFSAMVHDIGKIGIRDALIAKEGKLTEEEYREIQQHPILGERILSKITKAPHLSIGAYYHHERYDGKGYPDRLKGDDIPDTARIIAVAEAYDAMTSKSSYREQLPQQMVREEIALGIGTQFDPGYAKIMLQMIDNDNDYKLKENPDISKFGIKSHYVFEEYKTDLTPGIRITDHMITVRMQYQIQYDKEKSIPSVIIYDSLDERYYHNEKLQKEMDFTEYAAIALDGTVTKGDIREYSQVKKNMERVRSWNFSKHHAVSVIIKAVKQGDHILIQMHSESKIEEYILALKDSSRWAYLAISGENCVVDITGAEIAGEPVADHFVPRIVEEISYIKGPQGDIPNIQVDGWRSAFSEAVPVVNGMKVSFHGMSLPSAKRIWHCPIVSFFYSENGQMFGPGFDEIALFRYDGESWSDKEDVKPEVVVTREDSFIDWDFWRRKNKEGVDCVFTVERSKGKIKVVTENSGLSMEVKITFPDHYPKLYLAFTGDQCAITDIHIQKL